MTVKSLKAAIAEAKRFIRAAEKVETPIIGSGIYIQTGKDSGSCRRASMDLTRALAEMRKPE